MSTTNATGASDDSLETLFSTLFRDARRYAPASLIPAAAGLISVSIFTRVFDSSEYGLYSLVLASVAILNAILSVWIQQSILRYLPRFKAENRLAEFSAKTKGIVAVVCLVVGGLFLAVYGFARTRLGAYEPLFLPALLLLITEITFLNLNTVFQADLRSGRFAVFKIAGALARLGFALVIVFFYRRDVTGLLMGAALGQLLLLPTMWRWAGMLENGESHRVVFDAAVLKRFAVYGIPLIGWAVGGEVLALSDRFIIGAFRGSAEVGVYSANYGLVYAGFGLATAPLLMAAHPIIIDAWERRRDESLPLVVASFSRIYILLALPVVALASALDEEIVRLVLGPQFHEGYRIVPWVVGGAFVWGMAMYGHKGLELAERTRVIVLLVSVAAALNIALNLIVVPRYGYYGAAVTTFASYLAYPVLVFVGTRSIFPWRVPWATLGRGGFAAIAAAATVAAVKSGLDGRVSVVVVLAAGVVAGTAVYVLFLMLTGELRRGQF